MFPDQNQPILSDLDSHAGLTQDQSENARRSHHLIQLVGG
jgi:hypothetical protein